MRRPNPMRWTFVGSWIAAVAGVALLGSHGVGFRGLRITLAVAIALEGLALLANVRGAADKLAGPRPAGGWTGLWIRTSPAAMRFYGAFFIALAIIVAV